MITNILLDHQWLSPTVLAVLVLLGPLAGRSLVRRSRLAWTLTAASLLPVALLTLVPVDRRLFARCTVQFALPTPGRVELMANVVLFVAVALFAGVASRRPFAVFVGASALSAGTEAMQALLTGLGRSCDTGDWLSNTIGAAIGSGLAAVSMYLARRERAARTTA